MQTSPHPASSLLRALGLRARLVVIAAASACWLVFLLGLYLAAFYGPRYAGLAFVVGVCGFGAWGFRKLHFLAPWLHSLDTTPYPEIFGQRAEFLKFALAALFIAYCMSAFLVPGPPEVRIGLAAVFALVPYGAETLLPTPQKAQPHRYHFLIVAAATPIALLAVFLSGFAG